MRWRLMLTIFAVALVSMALFQFVWAAHEAGLGGDDAVLGAANEANALRTGTAGLVLLVVIGLVSTPPARRLMLWIWERVYRLW
jgi:hypothetical protein